MSNRLPPEAVEMMAHLLVDTYVVDDVVQRGLAASDCINALFLQRRSGGGAGKTRRSTSTAKNVVYYGKKVERTFAGDE